MADINVLVVVDTSNIRKDNVKHTVVLVDDNLDTDEERDDSETFTINARSGDTVQFKITAVDMKTQTQFEQFKWENEEGSKHCFAPMPFLSNDWTGTVTGDPGDHENFSIRFNVEGNVHNPFTLDPKIKIDSGG